MATFRPLSVFDRAIRESSTDEDEQLGNALLVRTPLWIANVSVIWWMGFFILGKPWSAIIPLSYQIITYVSLAALVRTRNFRFFRTMHLTLILLLPAMLQWSLGGFVNSGAMIIWAFATVLGAQIFGASAVPWATGFVVLTVGSGLADPWLSARIEPLPSWAIVAYFVVNVAFVAMMTFAGFRFFVRQRDRARAELETERQRSERLLLNILPEPIADRLKAGESTIADRVEGVTVLFADLVGFTPLSAGMGPDRVVSLLNDIFTTLDDLAELHGLEKIKTVGDEYMVVGGLPTAKADHIEATAAFALDVLEAVSAKPGAPQMRIGMQTGPVIAGVIGSTKFAYDLWGDTVNTASRMESHGVPGRIQVTSTVRDALVDSFLFEDRGPVEIKGKGLMDTYFLVGRVTQSIDDFSP